ncbi:hypothetical protein Tco_0840890 [Tanacetum coccineum]|uniref:Uncharacterized protein n=1 Tax=Tanacetum coccineum TaxID=301880 RepID=A0ABQ5AVL6_9ASTR
MEYSRTSIRKDVIYGDTGELLVIQRALVADSTLDNVWRCTTFSMRGAHLMESKAFEISKVAYALVIKEVRKDDPPPPLDILIPLLKIFQSVFLAVLPPIRTIQHGLDLVLERRDEKKRLDHLKQDPKMLVIKRFSERKKVFKERKKTEKIYAKRMVVKEIEDGLLEEMEKFGWLFEQDIDGESEDDNEKKLVMVNEEGLMIK